MKERQKTDLCRISDQLEAHRDRLQGMWLLLDSQLVFMETNDPTEKTIESLRPIITDRIDRESTIIAALVSELDTMAEGEGVGELETPGGGKHNMLIVEMEGKSMSAGKNWAQMAAESYRAMNEKYKGDARIDVDAIDREARVLEHLGEALQVDPAACQLFMDCAAVNEEARAYALLACERAGLDRETAERVMQALRGAFDEYKAAEALAEAPNVWARYDEKEGKA